MKMLFRLAFCAALVAPAADAAAGDRRRGDQAAAWEARKSGQLLPWQEIERRVLPTMRGWRYLGFDYDPARRIYTLRFMRNGTVVWVEADGRTGTIVGRSD